MVVIRGGLTHFPPRAPCCSNDTARGAQRFPATFNEWFEGLTGKYVSIVKLPSGWAQPACRAVQSESCGHRRRLKAKASGLVSDDETRGIFIAPGDHADGARPSAARPPVEKLTRPLSWLTAGRDDIWYGRRERRGHTTTWRRSLLTPAGRTQGPGDSSDLARVAWYGLRNPDWNP